MDLTLTTDQLALREAVRTFCGTRFPMAEVRRVAAAGGVEAASWAELTAMGVFSLRLPETAGGVGLGMAEAVLVFAELGRRLVPGPLVATELAASLGVGGAVVGLLEPERRPLLVEYLPALDAVLVMGADGVWAVDAALLDAVAVERPLDPLAPLHRVGSVPSGDRLGDAAVAARLGLEGALLTSAYLAGSALAVTDLAVAYSLQREQFGRPVGSFQALKHLMADMHVRATVAETTVHVAAVAWDERDGDDAARAVHTAKVVAAEAATKNAKTAIQVHGGMGYTWEVDAHLHLKRAWSLATTFGTIDHHADALARSV